MITDKEINHLAHLARLELGQKEVKKLQEDLQSILQYVDMLQEANVHEVIPVSHITGLTNTPRSDDIREPFGAPKDLLKVAPSFRGDWIQVPRIIERT